jgi:hypothetical protein
VLSACAFWVLAIAGALPTLALRQMFGDPEAEASTLDVEAQLSRIKREAKEIADAATS